MASDALAPDRSSDEADPGESHEKNKQAALAAWRRTNLLIGLVVFLLVAISLQVAIRSRHSADSLANRRPSLTATFDQLRSSAGELVASEQEVEQTRRARIATAQRELLRVEGLVLLRQTEPLGRRYEESLKDWRTGLSQTASSKAGQQLLADPQAWSQVLALKRLTDTSPPIAWRQQTERLAQSLAETPSETLLETRQQEITQLHGRLRSATNDLRGYRERLESLIESTAGAQPVEEVSGDIFAWHQQHVVAQRQEKSEQAGRDEQTRIEAELQQLDDQRTVLLATSQRLAEELGAAKRGVAPTSPSRSRTDTAAYRQRLPEMRRLLRPFLGPGYAQPTGSDGLAMETAKRPMSYSAIRSAGALEDTQAGLKTLFRLGGWKAGAQRNDRPLGDFPRMNSEAELAKPAVRASVRRAQQLLSDYGPQLVNDRLLTE